MNDQPPVLILRGVSQTFKQGRERLDILKGIDLEIFAGEIVALIGPSGAGKSTLLHIAGLLESQSEGEVFLSGQPCKEMSDDDRTKIRLKNIGFVYQYHHLLPEFSALENVMIPQIIAGRSQKNARFRANELLEWMELSERKNHRPARLSGGEQQRVSIARAVATKPNILLADEPTGNLDPITSMNVFNILMKLTRDSGLSALIATHNKDLAAKMDKVVRLENGKLIA